MKTKSVKTQTLIILFYLLALSVAISSLGGLLLPEIYKKETVYWAAQALGQDFYDLVLVVPFLIFFTLMVRKEIKIFYFLQAGTLLYLIYSYFLYCFFTHFNRLYFVYCASLGLSVYALALLCFHLIKARADTWLITNKNSKFYAHFLLAITFVLYLLWFKVDILAVISGIPPLDLAESGLITNPVHVLDLSLVLPAMFIASIQLLRKKNSEELPIPS